MSKNIKIYGIGRNEDRYIEYGVTDSLLDNYKKYVTFVKGCEHTVRKDDRYTDYVAKVHEAGYNQCAVLGNLTKGQKDIPLEMHHGPIFNLFDICDIVARYHLHRNDIKDLTTFDVGDEVLTCHEKDWIQVIMLSKTAHKGGHFNVFIDTKATVGRIDKFIEKYIDSMSDYFIEDEAYEEYYDMIERYLKEAEKAGITNDNGLFDTAEKLKRFK